MKTIKIGYFDRVWFDAEEKRIVGDMGFTICDSSETRFLASELDETLKDAISNHDRVQSAEDCTFGNGIDSDFAIYELRIADATYEDEDSNAVEKRHYLEVVNVNHETDKIVAVLVCATKEDAEDIILKEYGEKVQAYYITD